MAHSWGTKFVKYLLVGFNLLFVLSGIILIIIGASVKTVYRNYDTFLDDKYFSLPNLLIAIGCLIFFISFFGCYGAIKESWLLLYGFIGLLILIFIMEFSGGIAGYVLRDKTSDYLTDKLYEDMIKYGQSDSQLLIKKSWDVLQRNFECCGVLGPEDWVKRFNNNSLPLTCCEVTYGVIGAQSCIYNGTKPTTAALKADALKAEAALKADAAAPINTKVNQEGGNVTNAPQSSTTATTESSSVSPVTISEPSKSPETEAPKPTIQTTTPTVFVVPGVPYNKGCIEGFGKFIQSHAVTLGGVGFAIAVIQLLGILFACHLARQIKYGYYST